MITSKDTTQSDDPDQSLQSATSQLTRKVGLPRSTKAHQAILYATLELFADEGFDAMSIEAIAERAHTAGPEQPAHVRRDHRTGFRAMERTEDVMVPTLDAKRRQGLDGAPSWRE